jgi:polyphosphate glucokinase
VLDATKDWEYDVVTIGYPGLVNEHGPYADAKNLGPGWVGFDFEAAFGKPVRVINDAVMQALGSYQGGRMLFFGLGTSIGSALISGRVIVPLEIGILRFDHEQTLEDVLGRQGLKRLGLEPWRKAVEEVTMELKAGFVADYIVIGGGNAKKLRGLAPGFLRGSNQNAFAGGFRLWHEEVTTRRPQDNGHFQFADVGGEWELI